MKCKHCQAKVSTLHGGYCKPCKRGGFAEEKNPLSQFTTSELETELLSRQSCQFQRLHCTNQAQVYLIKPQQPACFNCRQDILILKKDHDM